MEISEPSLLTRLPRFGTTGPGRLQFTQVLGLSGGKQKKRHELCVAVNGNSIGIVEVVSGRTLTSFPVPPDAVFICQPYSSRTKLLNGGVRRTILFATSRRNEINIHHIVEVKSDHQSKSQSLGYKLDDNHGPIVLLSGTNDELPGATVLQESGQLSFMTKTSSQECKSLGLVASGKPIKICAACYLSSSEAVTTVLKSRSDLLASLPEENRILAAVYQHPDSSNVNFGIWSIPHTNSSWQDNVDVITNHALDINTAGPARARLRFGFQQNGSTLFMEAPGRRVLIDTTLLIPKKISEEFMTTTEILDYIAISNSIVLMLTQRELQLVNVKFGSILASIEIGNTRLKRKKSGSDGAGPLTFVTYFSKLKRVVMSRGSQLLSVDLDKSGKEDSSSLRYSSLLIANIGRGINNNYDTVHEQHHALGTVHTLETPTREWSAVVRKFDEMIAAGSISDFENLYIQTVNSNGHSLPRDASSIPNFKLNYMLSKVFLPVRSSEGSSQNQIKIAFLPPKLLKWCAGEGLLTEQRLRKAWKSVGDFPLTLEFQDGAIALAIAAAEDSLDLLNHYLLSSPYIEGSDLAIVIRTLLENALSQTTSSTQLTIERQGNSKAENDVEDLENETSESGSMPMDHLDGQLSMHKPLPDHATKTLVIACRRLARIGYGRILTCLRPRMSQTNILALIQFLRQQLFKSGYTRFLQSQVFPAVPSSSNRDSHGTLAVSPELSLGNVVILLSSGIDLIGSVGLLGLQDDLENFVSQLIPDLLSEISSATEALEESTYLQGILRETLRYAETVHIHHSNTRPNISEDGKQALIPGTITTLYTEQRGEDPIKVIQSALPFGAHAEKITGKYRIRKGGGQVVERSARELGMLRDRQRSKYSFERLVL